MRGLSNGRTATETALHTRCLGYREEDGEPCGAYPMRGSDYCFQHDPSLEEERQALLAGQTRRGGAPIVPEGEALPLENAADVHAMLRKVAYYLATGERIEPRRVTALTGVADRLLRSFEFRRLEEDLAAARDEIDRLRERCARCEQEIHGARSGAPEPQVECATAMPSERAGRALHPEQVLRS